MTQVLLRCTSLCRGRCTLLPAATQQCYPKQLSTAMPLLKFWERHIKGEYAKEMPVIPLKQMVVEGFKELQKEINIWRGEVWDKFTKEPIYIVRPGEVDSVLQFNSEAALERWIVTSDSDNGDGASSGRLSLGGADYALFTGTLDTTPPMDGTRQRAGYCNMRSLRPQKSFKRDSYYDWTGYTHLILRVRGDGRTYMLNLASMGSFDIMWHDIYSFPLYTRGGPYWQVTKIPFSKFFLSSKGRVQDKQSALPQQYISSVSLTAAGVAGEFRLELDYIGLEMNPKHEERFAYEMYRTPTGVAGV